MKKFLSVMMGLSLVLGSATCVVMANEPEKHEKKEEHKAPHDGDHKPEHPAPAPAPEHK
jgi:hypothetical protein